MDQIVYFSGGNDTVLQLLYQVLTPKLVPAVMLIEVEASAKRSHSRTNRRPNYTSTDTRSMLDTRVNYSLY
jgi:hypothetical protein